MPSLSDLLNSTATGTPTPPVDQSLDSGAEPGPAVLPDAVEGDFAPVEGFAPVPVRKAKEKREPVAIYQHKAIARFRMGAADNRGFEFKNGLLKIFTEDDEMRFLDLFDKLHGADRVNIVKLRNIQNTIDPATIPRTVRGAASTDKLAGRVADMPAGSIVRS